MSYKNFSEDFAYKHRENLPCKFAYLEGKINRFSLHRLWIWESWINRDLYGKKIIYLSRKFYL